MLAGRISSPIRTEPRIAAAVPATETLGTKVYVNLAMPEHAQDVAALPVDGVGLLRAEFMVTDALNGVHPRHLLAQGGGGQFIDTMTASLLRIKLGDADPAVSYAQQSLKLLDRSRARGIAMTIVNLSEAYVQCNEIDEAARLLGDAGEIAAGHSSVRLSGRLEQARAGIQPWQHTAAVRALDERLRAYRWGEGGQVTSIPPPAATKKP